MKEFAKKLRIEISKGLPGTEVQWALASSDRMIRGFPRIWGATAMILHELFTIIRRGDLS